MAASLVLLDRRVASASFLLFIILSFLALLKSSMYPRRRLQSMRIKVLRSNQALPPAARSLPFVTLLFGLRLEAPMIEHNCALLSQNGHRFDIYIDNTSHPLCRSCTCVQFHATGCKCPEPTRYDCWLCEKLAFIAALMRTRDEMVFIDSDLVILKDEFLPALASRTAHFDFLASYGHGNPSNWRYTAPFNSGLMFMRRLEGLNYTILMDLMSEMGTNNDQNVISFFVQQFYRRWDSLSLKWHCRYLYKREHNIDFNDCFTFHGRYAALQSISKNANILLRKMPIIK